MDSYTFYKIGNVHKVRYLLIAEGFNRGNLIIIKKIVFLEYEKDSSINISCRKINRKIIGF
jgi:hypothetical protein